MSVSNKNLRLLALRQNLGKLRQIASKCATNLRQTEKEKDDFASEKNEKEFQTESCLSKICSFYFFTFYCALQPHRQLMRNCLLKITVFLKKLIAIEFGGFKVLLNCAYSSNCLGHIGLKVHCLHFINGFG